MIVDSVRVAREQSIARNEIIRSNEEAASQPRRRGLGAGRSTGTKLRETLPAELMERPQWVLWSAELRGGKRTKVPYQPNGEPAAADDPGTWSSFDDVVAAWQSYRDKFDGVGYVFSADDPYCGIDLDMCLCPDTGELTDWAEEVLEQIPSYCEISPSKCGLKIIARGKFPLAGTDTGKARKDLVPIRVDLGDKSAELAVWNERRYFVVTGDVFRERQEILDCDAGVEKFYADNFRNRPGESCPTIALDAGMSCNALAAMRNCTKDKIDGNDGSNRLYTVACRCVEHGLSDESSLATIRAYETERPFPRAYSDEQILKRVADAREDVSPNPAFMRPTVVLPGGSQSISSTAATLGQLLAVRETHFVHMGEVRRMEDGHLEAVTPASIASDFEGVASLTRLKKTCDACVPEPAVCNESNAKLILASQSFKEALPPLNAIYQCPVLLERGCELAIATGYDRASGVYARGVIPELVSLEQARELLDVLLQDFQFASPADRSRAFAQVITPALVMSRLLPGRAPGFFDEADQSQAGKGYLAKLTADIYGDKVKPVTQGKKGVGGMEEAFDQAVISGHSFISLDNLRGKLDSQALESFLTEDSYSARAAYTRNTIVDPSRVIVMLTSNGAEVTQDLANRASCVRILKQPAGYQFRTYAAGDLRAHVQANQPRFLGAVFAIVKAWHTHGKPQTTETRHDFRGWAQVLDWIVQNLLDAPPLMDGHRDTQQRMQNPHLNWLRAVALAVVRAKLTNRPLLATDLLEVIESNGEIDIPGLPIGERDIPDAQRSTALQQMGRRLKSAFGEQQELSIDGVQIARQEWQDGNSRTRLQYVFHQAARPSTPRQAVVKAPHVVEIGPRLGRPQVPRRVRRQPIVPNFSISSGRI